MARSMRFNIFVVDQSISLGPKGKQIIAYTNDAGARHPVLNSKPGEHVLWALVKMLKSMLFA